MYLKLNENEQQKIKNSLNDISYKEFIDYEIKCLNIHNKNKHKLIGIVNL